MQRNLISLFLIILMWAVCTVPLTAQETAPKKSPLSNEPSISSSPKETVYRSAISKEPAQSKVRIGVNSGAKSGAAGKDRVSLNFDDADIHSVMQTVLGTLLKVDYIIDPRVKGRVTFRSIAPVSAENILPVMEVVLRLNGIAVVDDHGIHRVIPIGEISREPAPIRCSRDPNSITVTGKALIQVVPIQYTSSTEIAKLLTSFVSANAVVVDVPKGNQIVLVDTDANIKRLLQFIAIFDNEQIQKKAPQVFFYQVQNSKAKDIVALLQQIFIGQKSGEKFVQRMMSAPPPARGGEQASPAIQTTMSASAGSEMISELTKIFADELTNTIIILGTPEDFAIIKETIKNIDVVPRQVMIEGVVAQVSLTDNMSLGFSWAINTNIGNTGLQFGLNTPNLTDSTKTSQKGFTFVGADSSGAVKALISALATESKAKLLASPHILVSDNREARIQVGQSVPLVTSETIASAGVAPQRTIQYKDIGIILKVKPRINDSGLVALDLQQEVSTYTTVKLYSGEDQIILNKTEASTNLVVQDGQSIVIGGLIREDKSRGGSGIPLLSRIPVVGYLFGEKSKEDSRSEIIILLTPHVLKTQKSAAEATSKYLDKFTGSGTSQTIKKDELINTFKPFGTVTPEKEKPSGK